MARELDIKINVDNADAKRALADLDKKFNDTEQSVKQFEKGVKESGDTLNKLGSIAGGVFGGLSIDRLVNQIITLGGELLTDADALVKLHDATGLSLEGLQQIQVVTDEAGGSLQAMAKAAEFLQRSIAGGKGSAVDALNAFGLTLEDLRKLSPDEQFFTVAKAMQGVSDQEELMLRGTQLMGRGFAEALPGIKQGFDDARHSAQVMSDETVHYLDRAGDAWAKFSRDVKVGAAETFVWFADHLPATFDDTDAAFEKSMQKIAESATKAAPPLKTLAGIIAPGLPKDLDAVNASFGDLEKKLRAVELAAQRHAEKLAAVDLKILEATRDTGHLNDMQETAAVKYRNLGLTMDDIALKLNISAIAVRKFLEAHDILEAHIERLTDHVDARLIPAFTGLIMTWEQMTNTGKGLTYDGLLPMAKGFDDVARAEEAADAWAKRLQKSNEALQGQLATTIGLMPDLSGVAKQTMTESTTHTEKWTNALGDTAKMFAQLGAISGGAMGNVLKDLGQVVVIANTLNKDGGMLHAILGIGPGPSNSRADQLKNMAYSAVGPSLEAVGSSLTDAEGNQRKSGQVLQYAGKGASIGTAILPGWGTAVGAGVGALVGALKVDSAELAARDAFAAFEKQFGTLDQTIKAVGASYAAMGKSGTDAQRDLQAALDATHHTTDEVNDALHRINDTLAAQQQRSVDVAEATQALGPAFAALSTGITQPIIDAYAAANSADTALEGGIAGLGAGMQKASAYTSGLVIQIKDVQAQIATLESKTTPLNASQTQQLSDLHVKLLTLNSEFGDLTASQISAGRALQDMAAHGKQGLDDLGTQAVASFAAMVAGGASVADTFKTIGPSLTNLQASYMDLGIDVDDVALKNLMMQNTITSGNPALMAAIGGLSGEMAALDKLGVNNVETFGAMERSGMQLYGRLQAQVASVGGTAKDALIPMQGYLHDALVEAENLGTPLDANTQMLITQSQELDIWKDTGKKSADILNESMKALVDRVGELIDRLAGPGGVADAIGSIPRHIDVTVQGHYIAPDVPTGDQLESFHTGGAILPFTVRAHRGLAVDEVPIIAQTGEGILNRGAMRRIGGSSGLNRLNAGGGGGGVTINVGEGAVKLSQDMSESQARELVGGTIIREIRRRGGRFAA